MVEAAPSAKSAGFSMANPCPSLEGSVKYKYGHFMRVETYPNGGGLVLHMWQDEINGLSEKETEEVAKEFVEVIMKSVVLTDTLCGQDSFTWADFLSESRGRAYAFYEWTGLYAQLGLKYRVSGTYRCCGVSCTQ